MSARTRQGKHSHRWSLRARITDYFAALRLAEQDDSPLTAEELLTSLGVNLDQWRRTWSDDLSTITPSGAVPATAHIARRHS